MKKIAFLILLIFIIAGCKKVFKDDTQNKMAINNPDDLSNAITGLYYRFENSVLGNGAGYGLSNYDIPFINSDDVAIININDWNYFCVDSCMCYQIFNPGQSQINDDVKYFWLTLYQTVISANDIFGKSVKLNQSNIAVQQMLGEVYFIRAYTYFRLVRLFGQVPVVLNTNVNYTLNKPSFTELYNFIISDLQMAMSLLPANNSLARSKYVTPHRGTAKALLAEVYLTMGGYPLKQTGMYTLAASTAKEVMDSASFFGYNLLPDIANLWNNRQELNNETVFAFYFNDMYSDITNNLMHNITWDYGNKIGIQFYNNFTASYRKNMTYRTNIVININTFLYYDTIRLPDSLINLCTNVVFKKFYTPYTNLSYDDNLGRVVYLFRYARTLLTYAEAEARSGNIDASAYEAINQIRRRANKVDLFTPSKFDLQPGLSSAQFSDSVVWERALEFCGEPECRYFDLLRLEMLGQLPNLKYPGQGLNTEVFTNIQTHFFAIPEDDKQLNPKLN